MLTFKSTFSLSSLNFIKRLFIYSLLSAIRVVSIAHLRLLIFLPAILIPACASSTQHFACVLCIEVKLAGWQYTALTYSFSYLEPVCCSMSSSNCCFLTAYRFLKRQVRWSGIPICFRIFQFIVIHTVNSFGIVSFKVLIVLRATPPSGAFIYPKYSDVEWTFSFSVCHGII